LGGLDFKNLVLLSNSIIIQLPRIEEKMVVFDWLIMMIVPIICIKNQLSHRIVLCCLNFHVYMGGDRLGETI
jgi:hypothetical protein